jgi:hypothetical protein
MKEMYKNNKIGGFQGMVETEVAIPVKRERESLFSRKMN